MKSINRIIILAGGSSTRLGQPKQLLQYNGSSLIMNAVKVASEISMGNPTVVTGAYDELIRIELAKSEVKVVFNPDWENGIGSSVIAGLRSVTQDQDVDAVLVMVSDQPYVSADLLSSIVRLSDQSEKPIIACRYNDGTIGTPAMFRSNIFNNLLNLSGNEGPRVILRDNPELVDTVDFPSGGIDIDTIDDYIKLVR